MLQSMRDGANSLIVKIILFGLLGGAMFGLILMDVTGSFTGGVGKTSVARVGDAPVSINEFNNNVRRVLQRLGPQYDDTTLRSILQQVMQHEVEKRLFNNAAADLDMLVGDELAAAEVRRILTPLIEQGVPEEDALKQYLYQRSITEARLVYEIKEQIAAQYIMEAVLTGATVPEGLVKASYRFQNEARKAQYFKITLNDVQAPAKPTDEDLSEFYETVRGEYTIPEYREFNVLVLKPETIAKEIAVAEETLREIYDERIDEFTASGTRKLEQAIFKTEEDATTALEKRASDNQELKTLSAELEGNFISSDSYEQSALPAEVAKAVFAAAEGDMIGPVQSSFGWHVVNLQSIEEERVRSFDDVRAELEKELNEDQVLDRLYEMANQIDDNLASGTSLEEVADEMDLSLRHIKAITEEGQNKKGQTVDVDLPGVETILTEGFALAEGETSAVLESPNGDFMFVSVDSIEASFVKPLDEVKKEITKRWKDFERRQAAKWKAKEYIRQIEEGRDIEQVAADAGKAVKTIFPLKRRTQESEEGLEGGFIPALYSLGLTGDAVNLSTEDGEIVIRLADIKIPEVPKDAEELAGLKKLLEDSVRQDYLGQFQNGLVSEYGVEIDEKALERLFENHKQPS